jgi:hypothetical protein
VREHFVDEHALMQHLTNKYHPREANKYTGFRCQPCNRAFKTPRALEQHKGDAAALNHSGISLKISKALKCTEIGKRCRTKTIIDNRRLAEDGPPHSKPKIYTNKTKRQCTGGLDRQPTNSFNFTIYI